MRGAYRLRLRVRICVCLGWRSAVAWLRCYSGLDVRSPIKLQRCAFGGVLTPSVVSGWGLEGSRVLVVQPLCTVLKVLT